MPIIKDIDLTSFEELYRTLYNDLFHYALKLTARPELAEDAVHDTFVYIWHNKQKLKEITSVKFYFLRSVRNRCLKILQAGQRLDTLEKAEQSIQMIILPEELQLLDETKAVKERINKALLSLSPRQREIIFLKFFNNLDYEEIAALLNVNYQSVVNHVHRAILKLRKEDVLQHLIGN